MQRTQLKSVTLTFYLIADKLPPLCQLLPAYQSQWLLSQSLSTVLSVVFACIGDSTFQPNADRLQRPICLRKYLNKFECKMKRKVSDFTLQTVVASANPILLPIVEPIEFYILPLLPTANPIQYCPDPNRLWTLGNRDLWMPIVCASWSQPV